MNDLVNLARQHPEAFQDRRIFTDPAILAEEREKIFRKTWLFICHESEFPNVGDFKCLNIAGDPIIAARAEDGKIHAFFNTCRHRASIVELESDGNRTKFECPYHGFQYDCTGALIHVPKPEAFGDWFRNEDFGLIPVPRIDSFNGMVFGCLDPQVASLDDFLGEARELLHYSTSGDDDEPLDVVATLKYDVDGNWKLLQDNSVDGYHVPFVHGHMFAAQPSMTLYDEDENRPEEEDRDLAQIIGHHGMIEWTAKDYIGKRRVNRYFALFPNVCVQYNATSDMYGIRQIDPIEANRMQVTLYLLMPKSADQATRRDRGSRFATLWGPGGLFGADDARQIDWTQRGLEARCEAQVMAARGMDGGNEGVYEDEQSLRGFRLGWSHYMGR